MRVECDCACRVSVGVMARLSVSASVNPAESFPPFVAQAHYAGRAFAVAASAILTPTPAYGVVAVCVGYGSCLSISLVLSVENGVRCDPREVCHPVDNLKLMRQPSL